MEQQLLLPSDTVQDMEAVLHAVEDGKEGDEVEEQLEDAVEKVDEVEESEESEEQLEDAVEKVDEVEESEEQLEDEVEKVDEVEESEEQLEDEVDEVEEVIPEPVVPMFVLVDTEGNIQENVEGVNAGTAKKKDAEDEDDHVSVDSHDTIADEEARDTLSVMVDFEKDGDKTSRKDRKTSFDVRREQLQKDKEEFDKAMDNYEVINLGWRRLRRDWSLIEETSSINDDDSSNFITERVQEVRGMCKTDVTSSHLMSMLSPELRNLVETFGTMNDYDFSRHRRQNWNYMDLFNYAARMALLFSKMANSQKKYFVYKKKLTSENTEVSFDFDEASTNFVGEHVDTKCTISRSLRDCLLKPPKYRNPVELNKIVWFLRASRAFSNLFPADMEMECAKSLGYEKYEKDRILANQGEPPNKFYYIVSGKLDCIRKFKLTRTKDEVNKKVKSISKGMTTNSERMEHQIPRDHYLVAGGLVEAIVMSKETFDLLTNNNVGPPLDFLQTISIFREFPCHLFLEHSDTIDFRYYCQGITVVKDSNRTPWIHIVKSGFVKVVRRQRIYDSQNDRSLLKTTSAFSNHAREMLGLSARQRTMRIISETRQILPDIRPESAAAALVSNPFANSLKLNRASTFAVGTKLRKSSVIDRPNSTSTGSSTTPTSGDSPTPVVKVTVADEDSENKEKTSRTPSPSKSKWNRSLIVPAVSKQPASNNFASFTRVAAAAIATSAAAKMLSIRIQPFQGSTDQMERMYLTGERKAHSKVLTGKTKRWKNQRATFVQLDVLRPGNVFGLDHMEAPVASEGVGLALISDGAEIIRISKRFFMQQAENNTMLKLQSLIKNYMTEDQARKDILEKDIWSEYKLELVDSFRKPQTAMRNSRSTSVF